jgi:hypothetical protein
VQLVMIGNVAQWVLGRNLGWITAANAKVSTITGSTLPCSARWRLP